MKKMLEGQKQRDRETGRQKYKEIKRLKDSKFHCCYSFLKTKIKKKHVFFHFSIPRFCFSICLKTFLVEELCQ